MSFFDFLTLLLCIPEFLHHLTVHLLRLLTFFNSLAMNLFSLALSFQRFINLGLFNSLAPRFLFL